MARLVGTRRADIFNAATGVTENDDQIHGEGGDDTIFGLGGSDSIFGGAGDDTIDGGSGSDVILGGKGADRIDGGGGIGVRLYADAGNGNIVSVGWGGAAGQRRRV